MTVSSDDHAAGARAVEASAPGAYRRLLDVGERYALLVVLLAVCAFFSLLPASDQYFPTRANFATLTADTAVVAALAVAALFPLITGSFDFSIAAIMSVSAMICATTMSRFHEPLAVALVLAVLVGLVIGLANGFLVAYAGMSAFITTLGAATLLDGIIQWYTHGLAIASGISSALTDFGSLTWFGVPRIVYAVVLIALVSWYLLSLTGFGRRLYALGSNRRAAHLVGVNVKRGILLSFVLSGTISGIAGVLLIARQGAAGTDAATGLLFPAYAAAFLGATAIDPGRHNVPGTMIGVLLVAVSVSGLTLAGANSWVSPVFNGAALLVAVGLATFLRARRGAQGSVGNA
jgi:ribose transport system permease protein